MDEQLSADPRTAGGHVKSGLISVVVVNWNRKTLLEECLRSLGQQTLSAFEAIVVDNGSSDGSVEMLKATRWPFPVELIENRDNQGFCAANNQGIERARGEFIALLNNDAVASAGWLEALVAAFEDPGVGMAASKILIHDEPHRIDKVGHLIYFDGQNRGRGTGEIDRGQYDQIEEVAWPDGCAAMYRRSMLDEIGGFDEDFFAYADDAELGLRARIAGWSCLYMPQAVVRHHRGQTLGQVSTRRIELIERNRVLLAAKLFPWSLLWLNGAYYLARIAAGTVAAARNKGDVSRFPGVRGKLRLMSALLRADLQALAMLPAMFRKRAGIRRIRKLNSSQTRELLKRYRIPLRELMEQSQ